MNYGRNIQPSVSIDELKRGHVYIFQWSCDNGYYRGTFEGAQVRFLDFGNSALVESDSILRDKSCPGTVSRYEIYNLETDFLDAPFAFR